MRATFEHNNNKERRWERSGKRKIEWAPVTLYLSLALVA
ncbi:hypothetical protein HCDSEM_031 [Candidatus Hodgkinia cicadicola Dsem]|nr:hypothetical protein HCDSEM_031 [Candidatus Hodgkinia cicadicola Dsem]